MVFEAVVEACRNLGSGPEERVIVREGGEDDTEEEADS